MFCLGYHYGMFRVCVRVSSMFIGFVSGAFVCLKGAFRCVQGLSM